jgi:hypothetical protein
MLRVMRNHRRAAHGERRLRGPVGHAGAARPRQLPGPGLVAHATAAWDKAVALGAKNGYRNAQSTVIAPTGTIGLVMDCDTTGIEPDFALVKFKKLAGGGYFKIINRAVPRRLKTLGYTDAQIEAIIEAYAVGHGTLAGAGHQPRKPQGQGLHRRRMRRSKRACLGLRHQVRVQQVDARRGLLHRRAEGAGGKLDDLRVRPAHLPRLLEEGHRGRQHSRLRRDDPGGRAGPEGRASAGVRLRQPVRQVSASATCRWTATSA